MTTNTTGNRESLRDFDARLQVYLDQWQGTLGKPTCCSGCSNCCRGTVPMASSAEALLLLEYLEEQPADYRDRILGAVAAYVPALKRRLVRPDGTVLQGQDAVLSAAPMGCAFLEDDKCGIYEARPYACRAVHVWHTSRYCGRDLNCVAVPAELFETRNAFFWNAMLQEASEGRYPFYGHLQVMLYYLHSFREAYLEGSEFSGLVDPVWWRSGLIGFPYDNPDVTLDEVVATIQRKQEAERAESLKDRPYGLPRGSAAASVEDLHKGLVFPPD